MTPHNDALYMDFDELWQERRNKEKEKQMRFNKQRQKGWDEA